MTISKLLMLLGVMVPLIFSAGPNNVLCASLGARYGFRGVVPFIVGMNLTVLVATFIVGFFFASLIQESPVIFEIVKYIGTAFLLYVAIRFLFLNEKKNDGNEDAKAPGFFAGVLLNALNPKAIMALAVLYSQFMDNNSGRISQIISLSLVTLFLSVGAHVTWTTCGNWLKKVLKTPKAVAIQKYVFFFMLLTGAITLLFI